MSLLPMNNSTPSLSAKINAARKKRIETAPESFRGILKRALSGNCSPRTAIKAQCGECNGFDRDGIRDCTAYACPLWNLRPYREEKA